MGWSANVDVGDSIDTCYCGGKLQEGEKFCDMCKYMNSVFNPAPKEFESKRDIALRAISERRDKKMMVIE